VPLLTDRTIARTPRPGTTPVHASAPAAPKFELSKLGFHLGKTPLFSSVDLQIFDRSALALIGPSGCGKSTLLRMLNRMSDLIEGGRVEGTITLDGIDIHGPQLPLAELRRRVGMVFQKSNPFPKSVYENVVFGPRVAGTAKRIDLDALVEKCLIRAGLWEETKDRLHGPALALTAGQQQRLCIARALATEPEVLLMDEPASNLDPRSTAKIEDSIFELKRECAVVIVTHNMQQAARVADRTAFLFEGRMVEIGTTEQVFTKPRQKQTEDFITGRFG